MKKAIIRICALSCLLLLGCEADQQQQNQTQNQTPKLSGETLATVDGEPVSKELLQAFVRQFPNVDLETMDPDQRDQLEDHVINLSILAREAERRGLDQQPETIAEIVLQRKQALAQALIESESANEDAIAAAYEEHYGESLEVKARHILVDEEELARELIQRIRDGEDFAELAEAHSNDRGGVDGGDLGWFPPEQMVPPFAEAVSNMEAGELSADPVETNFGWHVIRVEDTRTQRPPLEEVRGEIIENLRQENTQRVINELREQANVER